MSISRVIAIDCGASRTALGVFSHNGGGLHLEDYAREIFPAQSGDDESWLQCTCAALLTLGLRIKTPGPAVLVLPAHLVLAKLIKTPRVEAAQREKIIHFEAEQNIPYALNDVVWDSVVVGEGASDLEVLLAAAKLDAVEPLCAAAQAAGFEPRFVLPSSLATLAGFRLVHASPTQSSLILNLGARSTTLLLTEEKRFVARSLALGGNTVTRQIAQNQACDAGAAEAIKLSDRCASLTAEAMESFAARRAQEITPSVLHFRRQSDLGNPARVHLTGGGARLAGLAEALASKLKVPVERLDVLGVVAIAAAAKPAATEHALMLADLLGAAATQLLPGQSVLNLLPPRRRRHGNRRRRQPWFMAAAALSVASLVPPIMHFHGVAAEARRKTAAIERALTPLRERAARNQSNLRQLGELKQQVLRLQGVYERRTTWLALLADLQGRLGHVEDVWLEKLSVVPASASAPQKLVISGRMLDTANPRSPVSVETTNRVKLLLKDIDRSPYVKVAEEGQRFDTTQRGILKFDFVLVASPSHPL